MAQVYSIDGVAINNRVRTTANPSGVEGLPSSAWYGEAMIAGVTIEDPEGELDLMGWHTFTHDETSCVGSERTFTGWITGKDISRGTDRQKQGAARIWDCEIIDQNAVWKLKLFRAASAQRPAETDIARMDFMRASAPMAATPVADNGRWNVTDNPTNFGSASYVAQYPIDLANSVAGVSGKNFYAYWDDAAAEISGHYDLVGANPLSTISISNLIADRSATCVYPLVDAVLTRSPEDQVNGVLYQYIGNQYVYVQDADLFGPGEFSPDNFDRDVLYSTDRVGLLATAQAQAEAQLSARSAEHDTITVTIQLPPEQVNLLHAGMRVASRFSHLPGYEAEGGVQLAVIRRNVVPPPVRGGDYTIRLELSNMVAPTGPGGGDPSDFPHQPCGAEPVFVQTKHRVGQSVTLDAAPTVGNTIIVTVWHRTGVDPNAQPLTSGPDAGRPFTLVDYSIAALTDQNFRVAHWYRHVVSGDNAVIGDVGVDISSLTRWYAVEVQGTWTPLAAPGQAFHDDDTDFSSPLSLTLETVTTTGPALLVGGWETGGNVNPTAFSVAVDDDSIELLDTFSNSAPDAWFGYRYEETAGTYGIDVTVTRPGAPRGYGTFVVAYETTDCESSCPDKGQWTEWLLIADGDGTTTTFTTPCPYADGSLLVQVDGQPVIVGLTETSPETGQFTLDFAPLAAQGDAPAEQVWAKYQGR